MNFGKIKYILVFLLFAFVAIPASAQPANSTAITAKSDSLNIKYKNPEGTEFWLCFQRNFKEDDNKKKKDTLFLELFISGNDNATVTIEIDGLNFKQKQYVPKGTIANIKLPSEAQVVSSEVPERLAVHVTSDNPISVYGLNRRKQTTDTYLGFSTSVLGTEYRAMCYTVSDVLMPQFAVVATEDSTEVTFVTTVNTTVHPANIPYTVKLNKGDVYQVTANYEPRKSCDLTGSYIKANKKIAVFSGHQCAYVTPKIMACNHLVEQMPPISSWGKQFYIGLLQPRPMYTFRILANEPDTKIFADNTLLGTLQQGQFFEANGTKNLQISANKPILVAQYSQGFNNGDSIGDPMMIIVSPTLQFLKQYQFATPINGSWRHMVNVVVPTKAIKTLKLDGYPVDSTRFSQLGLSRYSIAYLEVLYGAHKLQADLPFGMYSYGFGYKNDIFDAYGTMGGQSFVDYEPTPDTLAPLLDAEITRNSISLIARDDRTYDIGLKSVDIVTIEGLVCEIPKIEEGTSQIQFAVKAIDNVAGGRAILHVNDAAANTSVYTICFVYDAERGRNVFVFSEGVVETCKPDPGFDLGIFARNSFDIHSASFSNDGSEYDFIGKFKSKTFNNTYFGIYAGRRFFDKWNFSATVSLEKYSGKLDATGAIDSVRDENTMQLLAYQQGQSFELTGYNLHLDLRAECYFSKLFYALGGLDLALNLSKSVEIRDKILQPKDFTFGDGTNNRITPDAPTELSKLSTFRASLLLGAGISYPIKYGISAMGEVHYYLPINSIIDNWSLHRIGILVGLKYHF